jgi:hypothetical protein
VRPLLASIARATPSPHRVLFITDPSDDPELFNEIARSGKSFISPGGNYAGKINAGVEATTEDLIFTAADDLNFHPGWLESARQRLTPPVGVVGTNDLCNIRTNGKRDEVGLDGRLYGQHSTHSLVARWYVEQYGAIDEPGKLLHEGYPHEFVDDEFVATAKARGMYAHAADSIVEHMHPDVGKAPSDELYAARPRRMKQGRRHFDGRKRLWMSLSSSEPTERSLGET